MKRVRPEIFTTLSLAMLLIVGVAEASPSNHQAKRDLQDRLDKNWVSSAVGVELRQIGKVQTKDGYLRRRDLKTTTFHSFAFEVAYSYKDERKKVCPMHITYYRKAKKWMVESTGETHSCKWSAGEGQEAPNAEALKLLVAPELEKFMGSKARRETAYLKSTLKNLSLEELEFKTYKERFWYRFSGSFDMGTHHCESAKSFLTLKKENREADWVMSFTQPRCSRL